MTEIKQRRGRPAIYTENSKCIGPECDRKAVARNVCMGHYEQLHRGLELRKLRPYVYRNLSYNVPPGHGYETEDAGVVTAHTATSINKENA